MTDRRSPFWREVERADRTCAPAMVEGSLEAAVERAYRRSDIAVAFRRNRELVDVTGQFRWLSTTDGQTWVCKLLPHPAAVREHASARFLDRRLKAAASPLRVCVPVLLAVPGTGLAALVLPDLGMSMAEPEHGADDWPEVAGFILTHLVRAGVTWHGLAPRNVWRRGERYLLADPEGAASLQGTVNRRDLLFWGIDWCPSGGSIAAVTASLEAVLGTAGVATRWPGPDRYELLMGELLSTPDGQAGCAWATGEAWRPLSPSQSSPLRLGPAETCRLLDDLLDTPSSVRTTAALAAYRHRHGDDAYADRLAAVQSALVAAFRTVGADNSLTPDPAALRHRVTEGLAAPLAAALGCLASVRFDELDGAVRRGG